MAIGGVTAYAAMSSNTRISELQTTNVGASEAAERLRSSTVVEHPGEWIAVATALSTESAQNDARSIDLLERALAEAPDDASAWALLSFLHTRQSGSFTPAAENALRESNARCPMCNKALMQWRLTFTLQHWDQVPEDVRMSAFEGADFLRWWYSDHDYLRQVGNSAKARGIPFNEYRRKVNTKVRPNEIPSAG
ncbi:MAG: hypothetical protein ACE37M_10500 [Henriciella sp.]